MACITSLCSRKNGIVGRPWPATEAGPLVVFERLLNLRTRVHDKRAVLDDGLADGFALQQQELRFAGAVSNRDGRIGAEAGHGVEWHRSASQIDGLALKGVK